MHTDDPRPLITSTFATEDDALDPKEVTNLIGVEPNDTGLSIWQNALADYSRAKEKIEFLLTRGYEGLSQDGSSTGQYSSCAWLLSWFNSQNSRLVL